MLQHDVTIDVEAVDKTGGFIGTMFTDAGDNVAVLLLEEGLATLHGPSADQSRYVNQLYAAETRAKASLKNVRLGPLLFPCCCCLAPGPIARA